MVVPVTATWKPVMRLSVIALALPLLLAVPGCAPDVAPGSVGFVEAADPLLEPPNMMARPAELHADDGLATRRPQ